MNRLSINTNPLALGLALSAAAFFAFSNGALAESMSKTDYNAVKDKITAGYKSAKAGCASLSGNPNDICEAEAKGKETVAMAEFEAGYNPTRKTLYQARVAEAEADYALAKERCDDMSGNAKDVCVKEAKAAEVTAAGEAEVRMKTWTAKAEADEKSAAALREAKKQAADARKDVTADELNAQYQVAKERCDGIAGDANVFCVMEAKARFGKS